MTGKIEARTEGPHEPHARSYLEIPTGKSVAGWKEVPIEESFQPLVRLNSISSRISTSPQYFEQGIANASPEMYLREEAARRLVIAGELLPPGYTLVLFDAHRPYAVQEDLFEGLRTQLAAQHPELPEEEIIKMTEVYVSVPSLDLLKPSPHISGGAIDLTVADPDGQLLDMGAEFDTFEETARTDYFSETNIDYHTNRRLLYDAMVRAGFTNYPEEWWHFDFGNQFWAVLSDKDHAIYGLATGGESSNGK